jgi:oxygen-dependent protoporphyrinogen oxidase
MLPFISEVAMKPIMSLKYAGVVQAAVGYTLWSGSPLDAFGGLIPSKEKRDALGILFPSAIFEGKAPLKGALLSVFLGGVKKPEIIKKSDDEITGIVLKEIAATLNEHSQPDLIRIFRYQQAIPQYGKSTGERLDCIQRIQKQYPGLILAGNIRDGIGMADRVKQAMNIKAEMSGENSEK